MNAATKARKVCARGVPAPAAARGRKPRKAPPKPAAAEAPMSTEETARKIAPLEAPGYLHVLRAKIVTTTLGASLAAAEKKITEALKEKAVA